MTVASVTEKGWIKAVTSVKRGESDVPRFIILSTKDNNANQNKNRLKIFELTEE